MRVGICLLICEIHLHDNINSRKWEVWDHNTSKTPPLFIEMPVPSKECDWSCVCVRGIDFVSVSTIS